MDGPLRAAVQLRGLSALAGPGLRARLVLGCAQAGEQTQVLQRGRAAAGGDGAGDIRVADPHRGPARRLRSPGRLIQDEDGAAMQQDTTSMSMFGIVSCTKPLIDFACPYKGAARHLAGPWSRTLMSKAVPIATQKYMS